MSKAPIINDALASYLPSSNELEVRWRVSAERPETQVSVYINREQPTMTQTVELEDGSTTEVVTPQYIGARIAGPLPTTIDGTFQSTRIQVADLESGDYYIWLEADDGNSAPTRVYARQATALAAATPPVDADEHGNALIQQDDVYRMTVEQTWSKSWQGNIQTTTSYRTLQVQWDALENPDANQFVVLVGRPGSSAVRRVEVGSLRTYTLRALHPGWFYTIQIEATDEAQQRTALSELVTVWVDWAPFEISTPITTGLTLDGALQLDLRATTAITTYPGMVALSTAELPHGITARFEPSMLHPSLDGVIATLTLSATESLARGTYPITVIASGGGVTRTLPLAVTVVGTGFNLDVSPTLLMVPRLPDAAQLAVLQEAGLPLPPPPVLTVALRDIRAADTPVRLAVEDLPSYIDSTFLRNGTAITNPMFFAEGQIEVELTTQLEVERDAQAHWVPQGISRVIGYGPYSIDRSVGISITTVSPYPVIRGIMPADLEQVTGRELTPGETLVLTVEVDIPPAWNDAALRLVADTQGLPAGTVVQFQRLDQGDPVTGPLNLQGAGFVPVRITTTLPVDSTPGWDTLRLEIRTADDVLLDRQVVTMHIQS